MGDLVKMLFLFNGGALIAILALLGALARNGQKFPPAIDEIVRTFGFGLAAIVIASLAAWLAQDALSTQHQDSVLGDTSDASIANYRAIAVLIAICGMIASLVFGIIGMTKSADALGVFAEQVASSEAQPLKS